MADEEILQESAEAPKKKDGGGFSFIHIIIICAAVIVVTAGSTMFVLGKIKSISTDVDERVKHTINSAVNENTSQFAKDYNKISLCEKETEKLVDFEDLVVNLADGDHYLSIKGSICIDEEKMNAGKPKKKEKAEGGHGGGGGGDEFKHQLTIIRYITNEFFSRYTKADLFPASPEATAAPTATTEEDQYKDEYAQGEGGGQPSFPKQLDRFRVEFKRYLDERGVNYVEDVYFKEFLIQ